MLKYLSDELREQRARLLARAAPLEADVGALLSATVDAVAPAAARPWLRDLDERGHARLAVFEAQELRERRRRASLLGLEHLEELLRGHQMSGAYAIDATAYARWRGVSRITG